MKAKHHILTLLATASFALNLNAQQAAAPVNAPSSSFSAIGKWRGLFKLKPGLEVPFNFEISNSNGKQKLYFINADEHFEGGVIRQTTDSLFIKLDQFDNELAFKINGESLTGTLRKQDLSSGHATTVIAERGKDYRFEPTGKTAAGDFSGTYDVTFISANGKEEKTVGLFKQTGNKLSGTFLKVTGDSRYLEGTVEGNDFQLSSFIGSSPAYYRGSFSADGTLKGEIVGIRGSQAFSGNKNSEAALPDPYKLTYLKEGYKTLDFSFPDADGKKISLKDEKYKNKVVILSIGGTWCPNCVDETAFLAPWYKKNKNRGVEVIGLQYEQKTDADYVRKVLTRFRERFGIEYPQVIGGVADKQVVLNSLPGLNTFISFPTTIIINKKGEVAQIHTGYSGPATGKYYDEFVKDFNKEIDTLLSQK